MNYEKKSQAVTALASFGLACAKAMASKKAQAENREMKIAFDRVLDLDTFVRFMLAEDKIENFADAVELFLTFPKEHTFERMERERKEKIEELKKIQQTYLA